jgi:hypothetical protein
MPRKHIKKVTRPSTRDEYTVVLEDLLSQFRIFGEGMSYMSNTLDEHTQILKEHSKILKEHSVMLKEHSKILKEHSNTLHQHSLALHELRIDINFLKEEVSIIRHNQITREEFKLLETRVLHLERARK